MSSPQGQQPDQHHGTIRTISLMQFYDYANSKGMCDELMEACIDNGFFYLDLGGELVDTLAKDMLKVAKDAYEDPKTVDMLSNHGTRKSKKIVDYHSAERIAPMLGRIPNWSEDLLFSLDIYPGGTSNENTSFTKFHELNPAWPPFINEWNCLNIQNLVCCLHTTCLQLLTSLHAHGFSPVFGDLQAAHSEDKPQKSRLHMSRYATNNPSTQPSSTRSSSMSFKPELGSMTIIYNPVPGLHVRSSKTSTLIPISPSAQHAFVAIGESLSLLTLGRTKSGVELALDTSLPRTQPHYELSYRLWPWNKPPDIEPIEDKALSSDTDEEDAVESRDVGEPYVGEGNGPFARANWVGEMQQPAGNGVLSLDMSGRSPRERSWKGTAP